MVVTVTVLGNMNLLRLRSSGGILRTRW